MGLYMSHETCRGAGGGHLGLISEAQMGNEGMIPDLDYNHKCLGSLIHQFIPSALSP